MADDQKPAAGAAAKKSAPGAKGGAPGGPDEKTLEMMRLQVAATLASGMIAASGRSHTAQEAVDLLTDVQYTLYPRPKNTKYKEWLAGHSPGTPHR